MMYNLIKPIYYVKHKRYIVDEVKQLYEIQQNFVTVQKPTPAVLCKNRHNNNSWAELSDLGQGQAGQVSDLRLYCNWFVSDLTCWILYNLSRIQKWVVLSSFKNREIF